KPLALSSSEGDFQLGRISTRDDNAREYNLSVTARMLLIGESRFGVSCDFKVLAVAEMSHLTTSARWLRGLVDLRRRCTALRPHCVSSHRDHASGPPDLATISNAATAA